MPHSFWSQVLQPLEPTALFKPRGRPYCAAVAGVWDMQRARLLCLCVCLCVYARCVDERTCVSISRASLIHVCLPQETRTEENINTIVHPEIGGVTGGGSSDGFLWKLSTVCQAGYHRQNFCVHPWFCHSWFRACEWAWEFAPKRYNLAPNRYDPELFPRSDRF